MLILGLDPGTAITGYGLIEAEKNHYQLIDYGCIRTKAHTPAPERLEKLYRGVCLILRRYQPQEVAVEQLFFNRNSTTAVPVGQARGVLILACAQAKLPVAEYTPLQVKQAVVGYGRAEKRQVQYMVGRLLKMAEPPKSDDAADALAIAITHAHYLGNRKLRQQEAE